MDDESGDDDRDELRSGWGGESRLEWWVTILVSIQIGEADGINLEVDFKDKAMHI